jgi:hypothetical protein
MNILSGFFRKRIRGMNASRLSLFCLIRPLGCFDWLSPAAAKGFVESYKIG